MLLKVLKYKAFFFSCAVFLFQFVIVFFIWYLMSFWEKKKLKLLAWILLFIIISCNAHFKCKYECIYHFCRITKITHLYFVAGTCLCTSFLLEEWKPCTKLTFFFISWHVYILLILSTYGLFISKKELKAKGIMVCHLSLSFYAIVFSVSDWGVGKDMIGFLGNLYFSECHCLLSAFGTSLGSAQS